ncbi:cupredoxin domain-containing protein [Undibacterium sp.]|jgi:cytochrome c oxidase subunit 2|uniref:cupredoxin domain-containing protein n=1 Tax=Undibacterium sp. TaxID=1914977 RepID=UPI002C7CD632|nr:cupredoxin domain-containing protein [Undibacterium sp.]HTD05713.1 cupredoxin domain-containing protein [Undibacterium sp.]
MTNIIQPLRTRRQIMLAAAAGALALTGLMRVASANPPAKIIRISAKRFQFMPSEVRLKRGEEVVLELSTQDVLMGFSVPGLKLRSDLVPGKTQTIRLTPDQAGEYDFLCDVFCGSGHEDMTGKLIVME